MSDSQIKQVETNSEKNRTYRVLKGRQSAAVRGEFYFEAMLIDYALLEDRLRSFLYYMALLKTKDSNDADKEVLSLLKQAVSKYKTENENGNIKINNITDKIKLVRCAALWTSSEIDMKNEKYFTALKKGFENTDVQYLIEILNRIILWKDYRNEIIHGLMNKNIDSIDERIREKSIEGRALAEQLDNQLRRFKKGNLVRKCRGMAE